MLSLVTSEILNQLNQCNNKLDLRSYHITDQKINTIIETIDTCPIENLNISKNKFTANGIARLILALSGTIKILDISSNFTQHLSSEEVEEFVKNIAKCQALEELNISLNILTFDNILQIIQALRHHPKLKKLNLSSNITSYFLECEFLVDSILSVNPSLEDVDICGRSIRPRFKDDCLFLPLNCSENSARFVLQDLYFTQHVFANEFDSMNSATSTNLIKVVEMCPVPDKSITSYIVDHNGGTFYNNDHDFAIVIPPGAVSNTVCVEIKATSSWFNFYKLDDKYYFYKIPDGFNPISSFFWFSAQYEFEIPVYLILSHHAVIRSPQDIVNLHLLQGCIHDHASGEEKAIVMKEVSNGVYFDNSIHYCIYSTNHFCSICLGKDLKSIPDLFYILIYYYTIAKNNFIEVCFCPVIRDCREVRTVIMLLSYMNKFVSLWYIWT